VRVAVWNIHGANVAGRSSATEQAAAWSWLRDAEADLLLLQEVEAAAIPVWASETWDLVVGERGRVPAKRQGWGSVLGARPQLGLRLDDSALEDPWLACLYDYVVVGRLEAVDGLTLASVHAPPQSSIAKLVRLALGPDVLIPLPLGLDGAADKYLTWEVVLSVLATRFEGGSFLAGGDWNVGLGPKFSPAIARRDWARIVPAPDVPTHVAGGQLDHLLCDSRLLQSLRHARVAEGPAAANSDHFPLLAHFVLDL
jgi:hypothetical protein